MFASLELKVGNASSRKIWLKGGLYPTHKWVGFTPAKDK